MISFKQYITEARMAPLYHGTYFPNAEKILNSNMLKKGTYGVPEHWPAKDGKIVSLTRNLTFARKWDGVDYTVVFELDQNKLAQRYRITPFNYFSNVARRIPTSKVVHNSDYDFENQYEESVTKDITNLDRYLTKIIVSTRCLKELKDSNLHPNGRHDIVLKHPLLYNIDTKEFVNK